MTLVLAADIGDRISDFAGLVGLVLVLITLFTSQRAAMLSELESSSTGKKHDATQEMCLLGLLLVITLLLFVAGLPVLAGAICGWHPRAFLGPLRAAFVLSWLLLVGLVGWQGFSLFWAIKLRSKLPR